MPVLLFWNPLSSCDSVQSLNDSVSRLTSILGAFSAIVNGIMCSAIELFLGRQFRLLVQSRIAPTTTSIGAHEKERPLSRHRASSLAVGVDHSSGWKCLCVSTILMLTPLEFSIESN